MRDFLEFITDSLVVVARSCEIFKCSVFSRNVPFFFFFVLKISRYFLQFSVKRFLMGIYRRRIFFRFRKSVEDIIAGFFGFDWVSTKRFIENIFYLNC